MMVRWLRFCASNAKCVGSIPSGAILFFIVAVPIYIPTNNVGGFPFSTPSPAFVICKLFNDGHYDQCEVVPPCNFDLHFSNN